MNQKPTSKKNWRQKIFTIVFEADTPAGRAFDLGLLVLILFSVVLVMAESMPAIEQQYGKILHQAEWFITLIFTVEYILRLVSVKKPLKYATSFYGIIDLLSILPTYFSLLFPHTELLMVIRSLRLMRIFRILKLTRYINESLSIVLAMKASARRILIFLSFVILLSIILGTIAYVAESPYNEGFTSIPQSIYWAIVTITTVGYGDISPVTVVGKLVASIIMLLGYSIIAVPTGIVTVELSKSAKSDHHHTQACPNCSEGGHDPDANYCKYCGHSLQLDD